MEKREQDQSAQSEGKKSRLQEAQPAGAKRKQSRPPSSVIGAERNSDMATLALPFETVELNITFVSSGVSIAETMHVIRRAVSKTFLTVAFYDAVDLQSQLIAQLADMPLDRGEDDLRDMATRLERLSDSTASLLNNAKRARFALWAEPLRRMEEQAEKLDSLAESFRMSASEKYSNYVGYLVASAEGTPQSANESWRDFVATLHD